MRISSWRYGALGILVATTTLSAQTVPAGDSARSESLRRLFTVIRMEAQHRQTVDLMIKSLYSEPAMAQVAEVAREFFATALAYPAVEKDLIIIYRDLLSEQEVQELIRFNESSLGQRLLDIAPILNASILKATKERLATLQPELIRRLEASRP